MRNHWMLLLLLSVVVSATYPLIAVAQDNCQAFHAIVQAQFPTPYPHLNPAKNVWGGTVFASLGVPGAQSAQAALIGAVSGADADNYNTDARVRTFGGMGLNGSYTFAFGDPAADWHSYGDIFTVTLGRAVWNTTPGPAWPDGQIAGDYQASGRITAGAGRFDGATGSMTIHGPFFDALLPSADEVARWNPEIDGVVCGSR